MCGREYAMTRQRTVGNKRDTVGPGNIPQHLRSTRARVACGDVGVKNPENEGLLALLQKLQPNEEGHKQAKALVAVQKARVRALYLSRSCGTGVECRSLVFPARSQRARWRFG